jgi:hypothetical protein
MKTRLHSYPTILKFSLIYSYLSSVAYVIIELNFLPDTDMAKKSGFLVLLDPFVQTGMIPISLVVGFLGSFIIYGFAQRVNLIFCGAICYAATILVFFYLKGDLIRSIVFGSVTSIVIGFIVCFIQSKCSSLTSHSSEQH